MMNKKNNGIDVAFGGGASSLFLAPVDGGFELLDYEFDSERIHQIGGGRQYYQSCSGYSGAGYLTHYGELIPVGYYRVDTALNDHQFPVNLTDEISIMFPYVSHGSDVQSTLENNPVILQVSNDTIIYVDFYTNMNEVLETLLSEEELPQEARILKKRFYNGYSQQEEEVELKFFNLFGERSYYPWEFATDLLAPYCIYEPKERIHQIFRVTEREHGEWVKGCKIGQKFCSEELLKEDPCLEMKEAPKGWQLADTNLVYKVHEDHVYIVGWVLAEAAYQKKAKRLARLMPEAEAVDFTNFIEDNCSHGKYVEFELTVPKLLFFLDKEKQFAKVRKGIAKKVSEDVLSVARQFINEFNDKQILEAIPDDLVVKFEDSLESGNCEPGTREFVDKYFTGKNETTAGELKKYSSNWNVMRVLRYIAQRDMIAGKVKLEIPA